MEKKRLFNPNGDDTRHGRRIIKGNPTNIFNLNNTKYPWAKNIYREMVGNFWIPEVVAVGQDKLDYLALDKNTQHQIKSFLSFLTFLDSVQTHNLPNISDYITAPEIVSLLTLQAYQEVIHSQSYSYILETVIPAEETNDVYDLWRINNHLLSRNEYIANLYQEFVDNPSDKSFARSVVANYVLESIYFYNGFMLFYSIADNGLIPGVADIIRYINRDEQTHVVLFRNIINDINNENPGFISVEMVNELFSLGVEAEVAWADSILGKNKNNRKYTQYLANKRIAEIGFEPLYPPADSYNPYERFELLSGVSGGGLKQNFFETKVTNYTNSGAMNGWDF